MGLSSWLFEETNLGKENIYTEANRKLYIMATNGTGIGVGERFEGMTFTEMAKALVREGANPNVNYSESPFLTHCLARWSYSKYSSQYPRGHIIHALLEAGADPNIHDERNNTTPFHIVLKQTRGCIEVRREEHTWESVYACAYYFEIVVDMLKHGGLIATLREYSDIINYLKNPESLNSEYLTEKIKSCNFNPNDYGI